MYGNYAQVEQAMARGKLTAGRVAERMGNVYPANVNTLLARIRNGKPVRPATLGALADALGVDVSEITADKPPVMPPTPRKRSAAAMRQPGKAVRA